MNDEQFEGRMEIVEVEVSQLMANQLRARDTAQREALARVEAERDSVQIDAMTYAEQRDAAQAQLGELQRAYVTMTNQSMLVDGDHCYYLKSAEMAAFDRIFTGAQAEQQEGEYYCKVCRNHGCVSGCHPDYYKQQEAQGAQAVDERAVYETWLAEKALSLPLLRGVTNLRYLSGNGQYVNDWAMFGYMVWIARAALATQPAKIKLPPRQEYKLGQWSFFDNYAAASWNQCLDAVEKLNAARGAEHDQ